MKRFVLLCICAVGMQGCSLFGLRMQAGPPPVKPADLQTVAIADDTQRQAIATLHDLITEAIASMQAKQEEIAQDQLILAHDLSRAMIDAMGPARYPTSIEPAKVEQLEQAVVATAIAAKPAAARIEAARDAPPAQPSVWSKVRFGLLVALALFGGALAFYFYVTGARLVAAVIGIGTAGILVTYALLMYLDYIVTAMQVTLGIAVLAVLAYFIRQAIITRNIVTATQAGRMAGAAVSSEALAKQSEATKAAMSPAARAQVDAIKTAGNLPSTREVVP